MRFGDVFSHADGSVIMLIARRFLTRDLIVLRLTEFPNYVVFGSVGLARVRMAGIHSGNIGVMREDDLVRNWKWNPHG